MRCIDCAIPAHTNPRDLHERTKLFHFVGQLVPMLVHSHNVVLQVWQHCVRRQIASCGNEHKVLQIRKSVLVNVKVSCNCEEIADKILIFVTLLRKLCNGFCVDKFRPLDFYAVLSPHTTKFRHLHSVRRQPPPSRYLCYSADKINLRYILLNPFKASRTGQYGYG